MTDLPITSRVVWITSFLLAVAAHAALVLPWLWREPDALAGAGGQELDVISFILADPGVLETRKVNLAMPAVPAPADAVEEKEGSVEENEPKKEESKELQEPPEPKPEIRKPDAVLEEPKPKPAEKSKQQEQSVTGGAAARGKAATERKARAPAAASAGTNREYARLVSQALAKTKPKGIGGYGVTKVRFTIAPTGRLSSLQIASSSGDKKLDQKALEAVRLAVFAPPPPGMTVSQLTFEIPYQFR
jgi:periplasmic protein TonB